MIFREEFSGYPFKTESLTVPVFLASVVICVHHFQPDISILFLGSWAISKRSSPFHNLEKPCLS